MGRLVVIANQKGGVGKTTTAINLAVGLAQADVLKPVLLVDLDPQGNATSGLTTASKLSEIKGSGTSVYSLMIGRAALSEALCQIRERLYLLPSGADLVGAEVELAAVEGREQRLKHSLLPLRDDYSFILLDTPPSLGLLTLNAMVAADSIIVPMQCEYYALEGLSSLMGTVARVRKVLNPALRIEGIVLTMFDARNRLCHEIALDVSRHFPDKLFQSVIPRNVRLSESPSHGLSVLEYDSKSAGADAYRALAAELLRSSGEIADRPVSRETLQALDVPPRKSWNLRTLFSRDGERGRRGG